MYCIYLITFPNNKIYVGLTKDLKKRIASHIYHRNAKTKRPIYHAMNKYKDSHSVEVLENNLDIEHAEFLEKYYIKNYDSTNLNNGYNLSPGGNAGSIMSEDGKKIWKQKMQKHYNNPVYIRKITEHTNSKEHREKMNIGFRKFLEKNPTFYKETNKNRFPKLSARIKRAKSMGGKPFICVETGEVFDFLNQAAVRFNVDKRRIHSILTKKRKTIFKQYSFEYTKER